MSRWSAIVVLLISLLTAFGPQRSAEAEGLTTLLIRAKAAQKGERCELAITLYRRVLPLVSKSDRGRINKRIAQCNQVLVSRHLSRADAYRNKGDCANALKHYRRALARARAREKTTIQRKSRACEVLVLKRAVITEKRNGDCQSVTRLLTRIGKLAPADALVQTQSRRRLLLETLASAKVAQKTQLLGQCFELLGKTRAALTSYRKYLAQNPKAADRFAIAARVNLLQIQFSQKNREIQFITQPSGATIILDGRRLPSLTPHSQWISLGRHRIEFRLKRHRSYRREIHLIRGRTLTIDHAFVKLEDEKPFVRKPPLLPTPHPKNPLLPPVHTGRGTSQYQVAGWILSSAGVALIGGGLLTYYLKSRKAANNANQMLRDTPVENRDAAFLEQYQSNVSTSQTFHKVSIAFWAIGGAALATGIVLFIVEPRRAKEKPLSRWHLTPMFSKKSVTILGGYRF